MFQLTKKAISGLERNKTSSILVKNIGAKKYIKHVAILLTPTKNN